MQRYKKVLAFLLLAFMIVVPFSSTALAQQPVIFVSILPQKYFVEQIAGDTVKVEVMVMPGASPATYEPLPRQMAMLAKADLYLAIGVPFERIWLQRIKAINPNLKIVHVDSSLRKLPMPSNAMDVDSNPRGALLHNFRNSKAKHNSKVSKLDQKKDAHNYEGMLDPHVWLSPRWVKAMAKPTRLAISKIAPQHATQYRINTRNFTKRLDALDKEINTIYKEIPTKQRVFMTFHPSWGYYAMTYNLIQIPIEFEGKAPSPKDLEQISAIAKKRNLRTIFVQPQFSQASAKAIADSINASIVTANPLAENWEENLRDVSKKLAASFILCE